MARLFTAGFEGGSYLVEWDTGGTVPTFVTGGPQRSGTYAAQISAAFDSLYKNVATTLGRSYYNRLHVYKAANPTSTVALARLLASGTANIAYTLVLNTDGTLAVQNSAGTTLFTSSALTSSEYHRIEVRSLLAASPTTTNGTIDLRIDGTTVYSASNVNLGTATPNQWQYGQLLNAATGATIYLDDIAVNDDQGASQNSWPGDGKVVHLLAASDSARGANWTAGAGGTASLFAAVDNVPPTPVALGSATNTSQVKNVAKDTSGLYDALTATYDSVMAAVDTITLIQGYALAGSSATGITTGVNHLPNAGGTAGTEGTVAPGSIAGTLASGTWKPVASSPQYAPSVTRSAGAVVRLRKGTSSTSASMACYMALLVEYVAVPPAIAGSAAATSTASMTVTTTAPAPLQLGSASGSGSTLALFAPSPAFINTLQSYGALVQSFHNLLSYWRLNDSGSILADSKGADPGSYTGTVTKQVAGLTGDGDTAATFPGSAGNYAQVPNSSRLDVLAYTVEFVMKPTSLAAASQVPVSRSGGSIVWHFAVSSTGSLRFYNRNAALSDQIYDTASGVIVAGNTYYIAGTFDGAAGTMDLVVNGVQVSTSFRTGTVSGTARTGTGMPLTIGSQTSTTLPFTGTVDDVALYDAALTVAELQGHNAVRSVTVPGATSSATLSGIAPPLVVPLQAASAAGSGTLGLTAPALLTLSAAATSSTGAPGTAPSVQGTVATGSWAESGNPTNVTVTLPSGMQVGEQLIVTISGAFGDQTVATPSGWSQVKHTGNNKTLTTFRRVVDGSEGATQVFAVTQGTGANDGKWMAFRLSAGLGTPYSTGEVWLARLNGTTVTLTMSPTAMGTDPGLFLAFITQSSSSTTTISATGFTQFVNIASDGTSTLTTKAHSQTVSGAATISPITWTASDQFASTLIQGIVFPPPSQVFITARSLLTLSASASATATLAFTAQTQVSLAPASASGAASSLALTAQTQLPLAASSAAATGSLALSTPMPLALAASSGAAAGALRFVVTALGRAIIADGPTAYYNLSESGTGVLDVSGGGHDGVAAGSPTRGVASAVDLATTFASASSQRVDLDTLGSFGSSVLTASVEFLIKTTTTNTVRAIYGTVNTGTSMIVAAYLNSDNSETGSVGKTMFHFRDTLNNGQRAHITANIYDGQEHLVQVVVASATTLEVYVDGQPVTVTYNTGGGQTAMTTFANLDWPMAVGARNVRGVMDRYADMTLSELAFYPTRLTAGQVTTHYQAFTGGVALPLAGSSGSGSGALALTVPTALALQAAAGTATGSLAVTAATRLALAQAAAAATGSLSITAVVLLGLSPAAATSTPTLALTAPTGVPLAGASGAGSGTLAITAATYLGFSASAGAGSGSLAVTVATTLALAGGTVSGVGALALTAPTRVVLAQAGAVSGGTLAVTVPVYVPLGGGAGVGSGSLGILVAQQLALSGSGGAAGALALTAPAMITPFVLTNRLPNPSFEPLGLTGWGVGGGAGARSTVWAADGAASARLTVAGGGGFYWFYSDPILTATPGTPFALAATFNMLEGDGTRLALNFLDSSQGFISQTTSSAGGLGVERLSLMDTAPSGTAYVSVNLQGFVTAGDLDFLVDAVTLTETSFVPSYFAGDAPDVATARSSASLALTAPSGVVLAQATAAGSGSLAITAPALLPLGAASGAASGTLELRVKALLRPNADIATGWESDQPSHHAALDDVVEAPTAPATGSDLVFAHSADLVDRVGFEDASITGTADGSLWVYAQGGTGLDVTVELYSGVTLIGQVTVPAGTGPGWVSVPFSGLDESAVGALEMRLVTEAA